MLEKKIACLRQIHQINKSKFSLPEWIRNGVEDCDECLYDPESNKRCNKGYIPPGIIFYVHSREEKNGGEIIK